MGREEGKWVRLEQVFQNLSCMVQHLSSFRAQVEQRKNSEFFWGVLDSLQDGYRR